MTTNGDIDRADEMVREFYRSDEQIQYETFLALAEYEMAKDFADWCRMGREPETDDAEERYGVLHVLYIRLWRWLGADEFFKRLNKAKGDAVMLRSYDRKRIA